MQKVNKVVVCNQKEVIWTFESDSFLYFGTKPTYTAVLIRINNVWQFWTFHQKDQLYYETVTDIDNETAQYYISAGIPVTYD